MKLHLPKLLFAAVMAVVMAMPSQAALTVTDNGNGTTTVSGPDNWSATYNSIHTPSEATDFPSEEVDAVIVTSGQLGADKMSYANLSNANNIVVGGSGQLYLQTWDKGAISIGANLVFDCDSLTNKGLVLKEHDGNINLGGTVTLLSDLYVWMEGKTTHTISFNEAVSGAGHTLKTSCLKHTTFAKDVTLGGLTTTKEGADAQNSNQVNDMTFKGNVSIGTLTVQAETTLTFNGENTKVSLGAVAGNGSALTLNVGASVDLSLRSTLKYGTLVNAGNLVVEDWSGFDYTWSGGEDATENGLVDITKTYQILSGSATLSADSTSTSFTYGGQSHNIADGYTIKEGSAYVIAKESVTVNLTDADSDAAKADRFLLKGGTLNLAAGSLSTELVTYTGGSVNLAEGTSYTGLTSLNDMALIATIGGSGTIEVTGAAHWAKNNDYSGPDIAKKIEAAEGFTGTLYVKSGKFTYSDDRHGSVLKLGNGAHMQVNNGGSLTNSLVLESGEHEIHINGKPVEDGAIFVITGSVSGEGTFVKKGGDSYVEIKDNASVGNYKNQNGHTFVYGGSVSSLITADGTVNVSGGSVTTLSTTGGTTNISGGSVTTLFTTGGTTNVTGGSITTVKMKSSGNLNFKLAEGATSASYTLGTLSIVDAISHNCNVTIDSGVTVNATQLDNGWGFGTLTVNGKLSVTDKFIMSTGTNDTTRNVITGSGIIETNTLTLGNAGTYSFSGVTMKIGSGGIAVANDWGPTTNFGAMTIEATADWSSTRSNMKLVATGSDSTVINTAGYNVDLKAGLGGTGNLTKTGEGTLKIGQNNTDFTTGAVSVSGGKLELNKADGNYTISSLTLDGGALDVTGSVTLNALTVDFSKYSTDTLTHTLVTSGGLSLGEGVDLSTLTFSEGDYTGSVARVGESLVLSYVLAGDTKPITTTVKDFELDGTALTLNVQEAVLSEGMVVNVHLLDDTMMKDILAALGEKNYTDGKPMVTITLAGSESGTITANELNEVVFIKGDTGQNYWGEMVGNQLMYNVERIPEPTTATLSLLALMGLAARRRRK